MQIEKNQGLRKLKSSCNNEKTYQDYLKQLDIFLEYAKSDYDKILTYDIDKLQDKLEDWVMSLGEKGLKGSTTKKMLAGVQKYLDANRRLYYKKALSGLIKENANDSDEIAGGIPYTREDVKTMLEFTTELRTKALIHFLASTGIRPQGLTDPILRIKHLFEIEHNCMAVRVYDNHPSGVSETSKHGYWVFLTPEATNALKLYHKSRKLNGEKFDDKTPIFASMKTSWTKNKHLTVDGIYNILYGLARKHIIQRTKIDQRFDKAIVYGFRKRFNTILKLGDSINPNIAEKLMHHSKGLDGVYLKPTKDECFKEFYKAIPELTIDDSKRLLARNNELEAEKTELDKEKIKVMNLKADMEKLKSDLSPILEEIAKRSHQMIPKVNN